MANGLTTALAGAGGSTIPTMSTCKMRESFGLRKNKNYRPVCIPVDLECVPSRAPL